jgi:adenosylmethionine---8-amino-7-oxononanoate aminotransferase
LIPYDVIFSTTTKTKNTTSFHPSHHNNGKREVGTQIMPSNETSPSSSSLLLSTEELLRLDRQHVWHPYAIAGPASAVRDSVVPIESARGVYLTVRPGSSYDQDTTAAFANTIPSTTRTTTRTTTTSSSSTSSPPPQEIIDGMSNWWATIHGYQHPTLNAAIVDQLSSMSHIMLGGLTHAPAIQLCTKLCQLTQLDVCFLCDSGSVAVEVAMKMAIQYWQGHDRAHTAVTTTNTNTNTNTNTTNGTTTKTKFLTVRNGYHGDTFAAMSVCDPIQGMHTSLVAGGILQQQYFVSAPTPVYPQSKVTLSSSSAAAWDHTPVEEWEERHMNELQQALEKDHTNIAAMILEPIVQGAGGMRMYHPRYLQRARELCTHYHVLFILDEIATGFGRTNQLFAHEHCDVPLRPDIMCVGKALTGGYMSLAATLTTSHVAEMIHAVVTSSDRVDNNPHTIAAQPVLMHGPTFMGNPLACSVALASIALLEQSPSPLPPINASSSYRNNGTNPQLQQQQPKQHGYPLQLPQHSSTCTDWRRSVPMIEQQLRNELAECTTSEHVQDVRVLGAIGVVEMKHPIRNMIQLQHAIVREYGVWLRPFGKLIYTMPPYIITSEQLRKITTAIVQLTRRRF